MLREAGERVAFRPLERSDNVDYLWMQDVAIAMTPSLNQLYVYRMTSSGVRLDTIRGGAHNSFPYLI